MTDKSLITTTLKPYDTQTNLSLLVDVKSFSTKLFYSGPS